MTHRPIILEDICLSFPHKICFENFSAQIQPGQHIALIGNNGSGKTSLLEMIRGKISTEITVGYVPQTIHEFECLSGGQRFNKTLSEALSQQPDVLFLDEPTNHLDRSNRRSLIRMLQNYEGTVLMVSHDPELLRTCTNTFWHIDQGKIQVFSGRYSDYIHETQIRREALEQKLQNLERDKKESHQALMKEQERAKTSKLRGEKSIRDRKWPTIVSDAKARQAVETSGRKKKAIRQQKDDLLEQLSELRLPEVIKPKFSLTASDFSSQQTIIMISNGTCGYEKPVLENLYLQLHGTERIAITGDNGSGKTTLVRAILKDPAISRSGTWYVPAGQEIGYLDQHYGNLNPELSALVEIQACVPGWTHAETRRFLNDFLFRKNEEVTTASKLLSGGEKARLSLARIAVKTPRLLILDEITNNLDMTTREHVIQVLREYPGAIMVISHDEDFLKAIGIERFAEIGVRLP